MIIELKYYQNRALNLMLTLMYCYGPKYRNGKSLSKDEKTELVFISERLNKSRENFRETHPSQYQKYPLTPDENDAIIRLNVSKTETDYIVTALRETILDCEIDNGYDLKVITEFDLDVARELLEIFETYRDQMSTQ